MNKPLFSFVHQCQTPALVSASNAFKTFHFLDVAIQTFWLIFYYTEYNLWKDKGLNGNGAMFHHNQKPDYLDYLNIGYIRILPFEYNITVMPRKLFHQTVRIIPFVEKVLMCQRIHSQAQLYHIQSSDQLVQVEGESNISSAFKNHQQTIFPIKIDAFKWLSPWVTNYKQARKLLGK